MKIKCKCGEIFYRDFTSFKDKKSYYCKSCGDKSIGDKLRKSIEGIIKEVQDLKCEWVGDISEYKNSQSKLTIKCYCGEVFKVTLSNLHKSKRCKKCSMEMKKEKTKDSRLNSKEKIIKFFKEYNIKCVDGYYNNSIDNKFILICKECGEKYEQTLLCFNNSPYKLCQSCSKDLSIKKQRYTKEKINDFIIKNSNNTWINIEDFENINKSILKLKCECGEEYTTNYYSFKNIKYKVCKKCLSYIMLGTFKDLKSIINYMEKEYPDIEVIEYIDKGDNFSPQERYNLKVKCNNIIKIVSFKSIIHIGLNFTNMSYGEIEVSKLLNNKNIEYVYNYSFENLKHINKLRVDFYLPNSNTIIVVDGMQHIKMIERFHKDENAFNQSKIRDKIKDDYCKENNIKLIRIPCYISDKKRVKNIIYKYLKHIE